MKELLFAVIIAATLSAKAEPAAYINNRLVCGSFDRDENVCDIPPGAGTAAASKKWEYFDDRLWNRNYDNYQDLHGYFTVKKGIDTRNKYVYAHTYVYSPSDMTAEFRYGSCEMPCFRPSDLSIGNIDIHQETRHEIFS